MKIGLVRCPCIEPFPPDIGLGYLVSYMRDSGHEVFVFDLNIEIFQKVDNKKKKRWLTKEVSVLNELAKEIIFENPQIIQDYAKKILETQMRIIGFSVWDNNIFFSLRLAEEIKKIDKDIIIIFGGPECYPLWSGERLIQKDVVDIVVYGEGELTLAKILTTIGSKGEIEFCPGSIIKKNGKMVDCGIGEVAKNLDTLPFPDYRDFPLDLYPNKSQLFISFNRGCIGKCVYCSVPGTIPLYRFRSAQSIYEEIQCQIQRHPCVCEFLVASPALNSDLRQLSKLCDLIIESGLKISWGGNINIRSDMDVDLIKRLKQAGCSNLVFGIESGSQKVLDRMKKRFKVEDAERILKDIYNAGIYSVTANFIIGFPGESEEDFYETLKFIKRNKSYIKSIGSYAIFWVEPYLPIYNDLEKFGIVLNRTPGTNIRGFQDWYKDAENTPEIRENRKKIFEDFISPYFNT